MKNINDYLNKEFNCTCLKKHNCDIKEVVINSNLNNALANLLLEYKNILLVSDNNTYEVFGKNVEEKLKKNIYTNLILKSEKEIIPDENSINLINEKVDKNVDIIIGVGSGVINDLCKYVSFINNLNYIIIATAPSMDGYASKGAALMLNGMKENISANVPLKILADTSVLKNAPIELIKSGYGDIIGKYSCLNDWELSSYVNDEYFCREIYDEILEITNEVTKLAKNILTRNEDSIKFLMESLIKVGIMMSYVGNSRPASGSEHHMSHFFEITGILDNRKYYNHGINVLFSSYITAKIREVIIHNKSHDFIFNKEEYEKNIKEIYSKNYKQVLKLQNTLDWYNKEYKIDFNRVENILRKAPKSKEILEMIENIDLKYDDFVKLYEKEHIINAILYSKDLKDRYTVLWLYYMYFKGNEKVLIN